MSDHVCHIDNEWGVMRGIRAGVGGVSGDISFKCVENNFSRLYMFICALVVNVLGGDSVNSWSDILLDVCAFIGLVCGDSGSWGVGWFVVSFGLAGGGRGVMAGCSYHCWSVMWNNAGCRQFWEGVDLCLVLCLALSGIIDRIVLTSIWVRD